MHKSSTSKVGFINLRVAFAVALCVLGGSLGWFSLASTPSTGTLTVATANDNSSPSLSYTAGPFNQPNQSPVGAGQLDTGPRCDNLAFPCDTYHLTATLPSGYTAAHPNAAIKVTMSWTDTGTGQSDYDLYIYKLPRSDCFDSTGNPSPDCSSTDGSESADSQSASSNDPEVANFAPKDGTTNYTVHIVPYTPTGETVTVAIQLVPGAPASGGGSGTGSFGGLDATVAGNARYMNFYAPKGSSAEASQGEFNIGYNPSTHHLMLMNIGPVWRLTLPEYLAAAKPECCEGLWEDVSPTTTTTGLDPILWTDQLTQRTFATNFTGGAGPLYAMSDNDGTSWTPASASGPNGGADHETIGTGPYPHTTTFDATGTVADLGNPGNPVTHGHAGYYCSQDVVGPAACYRTDNQGTSWGPLVTLPYQGSLIGNTVQGDPCGGLHGHIHVAPDGTVWLPVNQCSGQQGGSFSTDGGITWTEFTLPTSIGGVSGTGKSQGHGADPSIAIDHNSRIYYAYVNDQAAGTEGHTRAATGVLTGCTTNPVTGVRTGCTIAWDHDIDLGTTHGIVNAAEIEAVGDSAGSNDGNVNNALPGRAAIGFIGTNRSGDYQAGAFPGVWYAFVAMTYDNGQTWTTANASPNDPVQSMTGVWQQGGSGQNGDRNLLDFNEITVGDKGQVLFGYSDGCTSADCVQGVTPSNLGAAMRVARQTGGRTLFAQYDSQYDTPSNPIKPKAPCLSGTRTATESILEWKVPDNGGADIQYYKVYRSNASGQEVFIGQTTDATPSYHDTQLTNDPHLFYKVTAINSKGESVGSNEIDLIATIPPIPQSACQLPGITVLTDPVGDTSAVLGVLGTPAPPGSDLISLSVAEPYQNDGIPRLVFTITTDPNTTQVEPPGWSAYAAFQFVKNNTTTYKGVRLSFTGGTPVFEYYTPSPNNSGGVDGRFVAAGSNHPADSGSAWADAAHTQIVITVKASDLGLAPGDTIKGFVSGTTQSTDVANTGTGATALYDQMPDSLAFTGSYNVDFNAVCAALSTGVVSRKTHGAAGPFDLPLPSSGPVAIEPRSGGANNAYTLVYTFGSNLSFAGAATVTSGTATVASTAVGPNLNQVTVELTGVTNAQHVVVNLAAVQDAAHNVLPTVSGIVNMLVADTTADGSVNSADITQTKSQSGTFVTTSNFREDVNADGDINSADIGLVKSRSGTALPPGTPTTTAAPSTGRNGGTNPPRPAPRSGRFNR